MTSTPFLNVYLYIRLVSLNVTKICSNSITRRHVCWIDMDYNHSFSSFSQVHNRCQKSPMCSHGHLWNSSPQERPHTKWNLVFVTGRLPSKGNVVFRDRASISTNLTPCPTYRRRFSPILLGTPCPPSIKSYTGTTHKQRITSLSFYRKGYSSFEIIFVCCWYVPPCPRLAHPRQFASQHGVALW